MIQRIQSIFLLLSSASFFGHFAFPFLKSKEIGSNLFADQVYNVNDHISMLIIAALSGVMAFATIFLFRNRTLQKKLSYLTIGLALILPIIASILFFTRGYSISNAKEMILGLGLALPLLSIILTVIAIRYINKDDKLVKSMDRLR